MEKILLYLVVKKGEAKQNEKLVDILKKIIFSGVKSEVVKKKIKELGIDRFLCIFNNKSYVKRNF